MTTIGPNSRPENFTLSAAPEATATANNRRIVTRRPIIHSAAASQSISSDSGTSFFTNAEWARKLGSRQNIAAAAMAAIGPASFHVHHDSSTATAAPAITNMNRDLFT